MTNSMPTNGKDRADYVKVGDECPIGWCDETLGDGHWVAFPAGAHAYHTDSEGIARKWQERGGMNLVPSVEPYEEGTVGHFLYG